MSVMDIGGFCLVVHVPVGRLFGGEGIRTTFGKNYTHTHTHARTIVIYPTTHTCLRDVETRQKPRYRDDDFVRDAVAIATKTHPFAGHKTAPLLARWPGYNWYRMNVVEIMHGTLLLSHITSTTFYVPLSLTN